MKGEMDRQWTGSKMRKKIKGKGYPKVVPLTVVRCMLSHLQMQKWWKWLGKFCLCQHALDPDGLCCALTLLTNADLKADITLLYNIISKQKSCLFNTLTRVGACALHCSKIKDSSRVIVYLAHTQASTYACAGGIPRHTCTLHPHPMPTCVPIHVHTYLTLQGIYQK